MSFSLVCLWKTPTQVFLEYLHVELSEIEAQNQGFFLFLKSFRHIIVQENPRERLALRGGDDVRRTADQTFKELGDPNGK
jgi:hypothetical protein